jgi:type VI secretion system protein ImpA
MQFPFDLEALLKPISEESPCGEALAYEGTYDRIREERRQDIGQPQLKKADWPAVERICTEGLRKRSKDLYLAAWLLEAWIQRYGFGGARAGFQLLSGLCGKFGFVLYPRMEEGERLPAPLEWIANKIPQQLRLIPVAKPEAGDATRCCWADYRDPNFERAMTLTGDRFLREVSEEVQGALEEYTRLAAVLAEVYGADAPAPEQLAGVLQPLAAFLTNALRARQEVPVEPEAAVEVDDAPVVSSAGRMGPIRSRVEAYRRLAEAADFLAETEPHSPAPYLVRRAICWGNMRFEELLPELVRNHDDLGEIQRLLRIDGPR